MSEEKQEYAKGLEAAMAAATVQALLRTLRPEQRLEIFRGFCVHCGDANPKCCCRRDE